MRRLLRPFLALLAVMANLVREAEHRPQSLVGFDYDDQLHGEHSKEEVLEEEAASSEDLGSDYEGGIDYEDQDVIIQNGPGDKRNATKEDDVDYDTAESADGDGDKDDSYSLDPAYYDDGPSTKVWTFPTRSTTTTAKTTKATAKGSESGETSEESIEPCWPEEEDAGGSEGSKGTTMATRTRTTKTPTGPCCSEESSERTTEDSGKRETDDVTSEEKVGTGSYEEVTKSQEEVATETGSLSKSHEDVFTGRPYTKTHETTMQESESEEVSKETEEESTETTTLAESLVTEDEMVSRHPKHEAGSPAQNAIGGAFDSETDTGSETEEVTESSEEVDTTEAESLSEDNETGRPGQNAIIQNGSEEGTEMESAETVEVTEVPDHLAFTERASTEEEGSKETLDTTEMVSGLTTTEGQGTEVEHSKETSETTEETPKLTINEGEKGETEVTLKEPQNANVANVDEDGGAEKSYPYDEIFEESEESTEQVPMSEEKKETTKSNEVTTTESEEQAHGALKESQNVNVANVDKGVEGSQNVNVVNVGEKQPEKSYPYDEIFEETVESTEVPMSEEKKEATEVPELTTTEGEDEQAQNVNVDNTVDKGPKEFPDKSTKTKEPEATSTEGEVYEGSQNANVAGGQEPGFYPYDEIFEESEEETENVDKPQGMPFPKANPMYLDEFEATEGAPLNAPYNIEQVPSEELTEEPVPLQNAILQNGAGGQKRPGYEETEEMTTEEIAKETLELNWEGDDFSTKVPQTAGQLSQTFEPELLDEPEYVDYPQSSIVIQNGPSGPNKKLQHAETDRPYPNEENEVPTVAPDEMQIQTEQGTVGSDEVAYPQNVVIQNGPSGPNKKPHHAETGKPQLMEEVQQTTLDPSYILEETEETVTEVYDEFAKPQETIIQNGLSEAKEPNLDEAGKPHLREEIQETTLSPDVILKETEDIEGFEEATLFPDDVSKETDKPTIEGSDEVPESTAKPHVRDKVQETTLPQDVTEEIEETTLFSDLSKETEEPTEESEEAPELQGQGAIIQNGPGETRVPWFERPPGKRGPKEFEDTSMEKEESTEDSDEVGPSEEPSSMEKVEETTLPDMTEETTESQEQEASIQNGATEQPPHKEDIAEETSELSESISKETEETTTPATEGGVKSEPQNAIIQNELPKPKDEIGTERAPHKGSLDETTEKGIQETEELVETSETPEKTSKESSTTADMSVEATTETSTEREEGIPKPQNVVDKNPDGMSKESKEEATTLASESEEVATTEAESMSQGSKEETSATEEETAESPEASTEEGGDTQPQNVVSQNQVYVDVKSKEDNGVETAESDEIMTKGELQGTDKTNEIENITPKGTKEETRTESESEMTTEGEEDNSQLQNVVIQNEIDKETKEDISNETSEPGASVETTTEEGLQEPEGSTAETSKAPESISKETEETTEKTEWPEVSTEDAEPQNAIIQNEVNIDAESKEEFEIESTEESAEATVEGSFNETEESISHDTDRTTIPPSESVETEAIAEASKEEEGEGSPQPQNVVIQNEIEDAAAKPKEDLASEETTEESGPSTEMTTAKEEEEIKGIDKPGPELPEIGRTTNHPSESEETEETAETLTEEKGERTPENQNVVIQNEMEDIAAKSKEDTGSETTEESGSNTETTTEKEETDKVDETSGLPESISKEAEKGTTAASVSDEIETTTEEYELGTEEEDKDSGLQNVVIQNEVDEVDDFSKEATTETEGPDLTGETTEEPDSGLQNVVIQNEADEASKPEYETSKEAPTERDGSSLNGETTEEMVPKTEESTEGSTSQNAAIKNETPSVTRKPHPNFPPHTITSQSEMKISTEHPEATAPQEPTSTDSTSTSINATEAPPYAVVTVCTCLNVTVPHADCLESGTNVSNAQSGAISGQEVSTVVNRHGRKNENGSKKDEPSKSDTKVAREPDVLRAPGKNSPRAGHFPKKTTIEGPKEKYWEGHDDSFEYLPEPDLDFYASPEHSTTAKPSKPDEDLEHDQEVEDNNEDADSKYHSEGEASSKYDSSEPEGDFGGAKREDQAQGPKEKYWEGEDDSFEYLPEPDLGLGREQDQVGDDKASKSDEAELERKQEQSKELELGSIFDSEHGSKYGEHGESYYLR